MDDKQVCPFIIMINTLFVHRFTLFPLCMIIKYMCVCMCVFVQVYTYIISNKDQSYLLHISAYFLISFPYLFHTSDIANRLGRRTQK